MHKQVASFMEDLEFLDPTKAEVVSQLYELFMASSKQIKDHFIYGGIGIYLGDTLIGGIWVSKHHTSLVFSRGNEMEDKYKFLEGVGKFRRHIIVEKFTDIEEKKCGFYIEKLIALEMNSPK